MSFSEDVRYDYGLGPMSVVLDLGAHQGTFSSRISETFGCRVFAFEPIRAFYEQARRLESERVRVFNVGIGASDRTETIAVQGDSSSILLTNETPEQIELRSLERVLDELELRFVDLLKLNVEGAEYEILEHILDRGLADRFEHIQVQFHALVPDAEERRAAIRDRLSATHKPTYDFPFVWEGFSRSPARLGLAVAAMIRADRWQLEEWLAYHRLAGVERFWIYNDSGPEIYRQVLEPLVEEGVAEVFDWAVTHRDELITFQLKAYNDAVARATGVVRWLALIDVDEFLLPMQDDRVIDCLDQRFADAAAVYVNWRNFGTGGLRFERHEPILERLTASSNRLHPRNAVGKSIVRPETVRTSLWSPHHVPLRPGGGYANGDGEPIPEGNNEPKLDGKVHDSLIRLNHYPFGDEARFRTVRLRHTSEEWLDWEHHAAFSEEQDTAIVEYLARYPAARSALWARANEEWPERGPYVTARVYGRLGNNLFQVATASAHAWDNGAEAVFPDLSSERPYSSVFRRCDTGLSGREWPEWHEPSYSYSEIPYRANTMLVGYFQSERYFAHHRERLLSLLGPPPAVAAAMSERHAEVLAHPQSVGVQLRYYRDEDALGGMYPQYGAEYLAEAASLFADSSLFVVSTNNREFARAQLPPQMKNVVILDEADDVLELYLLARCRDTIITNSSFGWWAAWLNESPDQRVVVPAVWVKGLPAQDVCPERWIALATPEAAF